MKNKKPELKSCPFCGGHAYIDAIVEPHKHKIATFMPGILI